MGQGSKDLERLLITVSCDAGAEHTHSRNVIIGVGGGIAAYKACALIRNFTEAGDNVQVVPTDAALKFVGAATFEALSGNPVSTTVFDGVDEVRHVSIGQTADLVVIAPATADLLARLATGRADDLLTATVLVATCPVVVAPAMHTEMWNNPATKANVETLRSRGITVINPAEGRLTGTDSGTGRLPEPEQIAELARVVAQGHRFEQTWAGKNVLITAGGTQENIDPVRYIGNRSSGRQGFALAEIAAQRGAKVTIIAGNHESQPLPSGARVVPVTSTGQMYEAAHEYAANADVIIMAAAVSDYRPANQAQTKLKKGSDDAALSTIVLEENPDILKSLVCAREEAKLPADTVLVGFAAETGSNEASPLELAQEKIQRKGCDLLMANDVSGGAVFGQATNAGWLLTKDGDVTEIEHGTKLAVAAQIFNGIDRLIERLDRLV